jgi:hypothetical protein
MKFHPAAIALLAATAASAQIGTLEHSRYHHQATGVEFTLPAGWSLLKTTPSGNGDTVTLMDAVSKREAAVWMRAEKHPTAQIQKLLLAALDAKAASRKDLTGYQVRPDSIQPRVINGQQALSAVADYTRNGHPMVEYLTWIFSPKTHALFYGRAPAANLEAFRTRLDAIVNSAVVP